MNIKLPKDLLKELDVLIEKLSKGDSETRRVTMSRLASYEKSGRIPLEALLELAEEENVSLSMYGISGLGRNKSDEAVKKLIELTRKHKEGNLLFLETIVDSMGETGNKIATSVLMELIGLEGGSKNKWLGWIKQKKKEIPPEDLKRRETLLLPVVRALQKLADTKTAKKLGFLLDHSDPLVRWHTIQTILKGNVPDFNDTLKQLAQNDSSDIVKEAAEIAIAELSPLPNHQRN